MHTVQSYIQHAVSTLCTPPTGMLYTHTIRTRTEFPVPTHTQRRERLAGARDGCHTDNVLECLHVHSITRADGWEFSLSQSTGYTCSIVDGNVQNAASVAAGERCSTLQPSHTMRR